MSSLLLFVVVCKFQSETMGLGRIWDYHGFERQIRLSR